MTAAQASALWPAVAMLLAIVAGGALASARHRVPHVVATAGDCRVEIGGP